MAKKSSSARTSGAARRPQPTTRNAARTTSRQATLVRGPGAPGAAPTPAGTDATPETPSLAAATPRATSAPARPAATSAGATTARPAPRSSSAAPGGARMQANRLARAQATNRARAAHLITAENYAYVIHDLRLTAILAGAMFLVVIILHFVLG